MAWIILFRYILSINLGGQYAIYRVRAWFIQLLHAKKMFVCCAIDKIH